MRLTDLADGVTAIMIFVAVVVLLLIVTFFATKKYDDARRQSDAARDDIRELRKKRLMLIDQALQMFSQDNPHADGLRKLADIYRTIDSEKKEVAWEEKYVIVMRKFMAYARKHLNANMQNAWKMSNSAVNENEQMLDGAREAYVSCQETIKSFERAPQCYAVKAGNAIMDIMRQHNADATDQLAEEAAQAAGIDDCSSGNRIISSQISSQIARPSRDHALGETELHQQRHPSPISSGIKSKIADAMRTAADQLQVEDDGDKPNTGTHKDHTRQKI